MLICNNCKFNISFIFNLKYMFGEWLVEVQVQVQVGVVWWVEILLKNVVYS